MKGCVDALIRRCKRLVIEGARRGRSRVKEVLGRRCDRLVIVGT